MESGQSADWECFVTLMVVVEAACQANCLGRRWIRLCFSSWRSRTISGWAWTIICNNVGVQVSHTAKICSEGENISPTKPHASQPQGYRDGLSCQVPCRKTFLDSVDIPDSGLVPCKCTFAEVAGKGVPKVIQSKWITCVDGEQDGKNDSFVNSRNGTC